MFVSLRNVITSLPRVMKVGLAVVLLGGAIDIAYHFVSDASGAGHGPVAFFGHLTTLIGMVITLFGLFGAALKRGPVEVRPTTKGPAR